MSSTKLKSVVLFLKLSLAFCYQDLLETKTYQLHTWAAKVKCCPGTVLASRIPFHYQLAAVHHQNEGCQEYSAAFSIFKSLLCVWKCGKILSLVLEIFLPNPT